MATPFRKLLWPSLAAGAGVLLLAVGYYASTSYPTTGATDLAPFAALAEEAGSVTVYRGLPHQNNDREGLLRERRENATFRMHGFDFYREPLAVSDETAEALSRWFRDPDNFSDWQGEKKCGGFHPDLALEWKSGRDSVVVLVCLGCIEIQAHRPFRRPVRLDMNREAYGQIRALLKSSRRGTATGKSDESSEPARRTADR
jgi:hypothetical protein